MAVEHKLQAQYLDIRVPGLAHAKLKAWGARLGVSAEGMARILLLMRMHEMAGEDDGDGDAVPDGLVDEQERSLALWRARLESIGLQSDELPAPTAVHGEARIYHVNAFAWPEGAVPVYSFAHVTEDGQVRVSKDADA